MMTIKAEEATTSGRHSSPAEGGCCGETAASPSSAGVKRKNSDDSAGVGEPRTKSTVLVDESSSDSASAVGVTTRSKRSLNRVEDRKPASTDDEDQDQEVQTAAAAAAVSKKKKNSTRKAKGGRLTKMTSRSGLRHLAQRSKDHAIRTKLKTTISPPSLKTRLQKSRASLQQTVSSARLRETAPLTCASSSSSSAFSDSSKTETASVAVVARPAATYVNDESTENWLSTFREWSAKSKLQALEQVLEMCDYAHIKHVHNFIEPKLQRDYISELPRELVLLMLTYVRPKDLNKLAQVSHYWNDIANDSILWKNICRKNKIEQQPEAADDDEQQPEETYSIVSRDAAAAEQQPSTSTGYRAGASSTSNQAASCCSPSSPSSSSSDQPATTEIAAAPVTVAAALQTSKSTKTRKHSTGRQTTLEVAKQKLAPSRSPALDGENPRFSFLKGFNPFKRAYLIDYNVSRNWCTRPLPKPVTLKSHDDHVITCLKFDGVRVISGSDDCTLRVWCALTGRLLHTLSGHTGGVWASQLKDNIVISGSTDRSVRVWNIDTGECIHVLTGHTSTVRCLALHGQLVVSGSRDSLLRIWNIETGQCLQILRGHGAAVRCVCFDGNYVVSGSYDFTIRVWEPATGQCKHVLEGHANRVYSLLFDGERIVSGSLDTTIIVWNVHTGAVCHRLMGHHSLTSGMQIKGDVLVSGNADSTVKIWSLKTGECLHTLGGCNRHMSAVTCMSFNDKFVVSSSDDGTVKLWDLQKGEFIRNLLALESGGRGGVVWRISMHKNKLVCAVGSRIGVEETKLILLDFDWPPNRLADQSAAAAATTTPATTNPATAPVTTAAAVITTSRLIGTSSASATTST